MVGTQYDITVADELRCMACLRVPKKGDSTNCTKCGQCCCLSCKTTELHVLLSAAYVELLTSANSRFPGLRVIKDIKFPKDQCFLCRHEMNLEWSQDPDVEHLLWLFRQGSPSRKLFEVIEEEKGPFHRIWEEDLDSSREVTFSQLMQKKLKREEDLGSSREVTFSQLMQKKLKKRDRASNDRVFNPPKPKPCYERIVSLANAVLIDVVSSFLVGRPHQDAVLSFIVERTKDQLEKNGVPVNKKHNLVAAFTEANHHPGVPPSPFKVDVTFDETEKMIHKNLFKGLVGVIVMGWGLKRLRIKRAGVIAQGVAFVISSFALEKITQDWEHSKIWKLAGIFTITTGVGVYYLSLKVSLVFAALFTAYESRKPKNLAEEFMS